MSDIELVIGVDPSTTAIGVVAFRMEDLWESPLPLAGRFTVKSSVKPTHRRLMKLQEKLAVEMERIQDWGCYSALVAIEDPPGQVKRWSKKHEKLIGSNPETLKGLGRAIGIMEISFHLAGCRVVLVKQQFGKAALTGSQRARKDTANAAARIRAGIEDMDEHQCDALGVALWAAQQEAGQDA